MLEIGKRFPRGIVGREVEPLDKVFGTAKFVGACGKDSINFPFGFAIHKDRIGRRWLAGHREGCGIMITAELGDVEYRVDTGVFRGELEAVGDGVDDLGDREGSSKTREEGFAKVRWGVG